MRNFRSFIIVLTFIVFMNGIKLPSLVHASSGQTNKVDPWANEAYQEAIGLGLIYEDFVTDYRRPITRQEYGYLIYCLYEQLAGYPISHDIELGNKGSFIDTMDIKLTQLLRLGLLEGYPDGSYRPSQVISRQEIMVMYSRLLQRFDRIEAIVDLSKFTDYTKVASWAEYGVSICVSLGLIQGRTPSTLEPQGLATVQESLLVMKRILSLPINMKPSYRASLSGPIATDLSRSYQVAYSWQGDVVGIDAYDDFRLLGRVYEGDIVGDQLYYDGALYFFVDQGTLVVLGQENQTSYKIDYNGPFIVSEGILTFKESPYEGIRLSDQKVVRFVASQIHAYHVQGGLLYDGSQQIYKQVISAYYSGDKWYVVDEAGHLQILNNKGHLIYDYGYIGRVQLQGAGNVLVITEEIDNNLTITRFIPISLIDIYIYFS